MWWQWSLGRYVNHKTLAEGATLPWGYGIAWVLPYSRQYYCLPIPLNLLVGTCRAFWLKLQQPCDDDPIANAYHFGYNKGFQAGTEHGMVRGLELAKIEETWLNERK